MHDISTFPQLSGLYGHSQHASFASPQAYGQQQWGQQPYGQQPYGQSPLGGPIPGLVPIVTLVPQALLLSLAMQSLQQAQGLGGQPTSQFGFAGPHGGPSGGMPQFGGPFGQPQQQFGMPFGQPQQQFGMPFGQPQQQFGTPFGQPQQQFGMPFGQPQQQFGQPQQQFGMPFGQPQQQFGTTWGQPQQFGGAFGQWGPPWQAIGGQLLHAGAIGRGLLGYQQAPSMSYGG